MSRLPAPQSTLNEWFNVPSFTTDVSTFMQRQNITAKQFSELLDIPKSVIIGVLLGQFPPSFTTACAMAEGCDLSLDKYRFTQSQHDRAVDQRQIHRRK